MSVCLYVCVRVAPAILTRRVDRSPIRTAPRAQSLYLPAAPATPVASIHQRPPSSLEHSFELIGSPLCTPAPQDYEVSSMSFAAFHRASEAGEELYLAETPIATFGKNDEQREEMLRDLRPPPALVSTLPDSRALGLAVTLTQPIRNPNPGYRAGADGRACGPLHARAPPAVDG